MTTISKGQTISATSICDSNCKWTALVLDRKGDFLTLQLDGKVIRKKVKKGYDGSEYCLALGSYSMAPIFK